MLSRASLDKSDVTGELQLVETRGAFNGAQSLSAETLERLPAKALSQHVFVDVVQVPALKMFGDSGITAAPQIPILLRGAFALVLV